jgi:hypothetical protein
MPNIKLTAQNIRDAILAAETGRWIDPSEHPAGSYWDCRLYDPTGQYAGEGQAFTASDAMGLAWLHAHSPDALSDRKVEPGTVPLVVPDDWYFKLTPPHGEEAQ